MDSYHQESWSLCRLILVFIKYGNLKAGFHPGLFLFLFTIGLVYKAHNRFVY